MSQQQRRERVPEVPNNEGKFAEGSGAGSFNGYLNGIHEKVQLAQSNTYYERASPPRTALFSVRERIVQNQSMAMNDSVFERSHRTSGQQKQEPAYPKREAGRKSRSPSPQSPRYAVRAPRQQHVDLRVREGQARDQAANIGYDLRIELERLKHEDALNKKKIKQMQRDWLEADKLRAEEARATAQARAHEEAYARAQAERYGQPCAERYYGETTMGPTGPDASCIPPIPGYVRKWGRSQAAPLKESVAFVAAPPPHQQAVDGATLAASTPKNRTARGTIL